MEKETTTHQTCVKIFDSCRNVTLSKNKGYGASWRLYRPISFLNKLKIKALRIRNLQNGVNQLVRGESIQANFLEIVNYSVLAQVQLGLGDTVRETTIDEKTLEKKHQQICNKIIQLLDQKNNDYGEAWRELDAEFFVDEILVKLERGRTIAKALIAQDQEKGVSDLEEVYSDICNYAMFAIILLKEQKQSNKTNQETNEN